MSVTVLGKLAREQTRAMDNSLATAVPFTRHDQTNDVALYQRFELFLLTREAVTGQEHYLFLVMSEE